MSKFMAMLAAVLIVPAVVWADGPAATLQAAPASLDVRSAHVQDILRAVARRPPRSSPSSSPLERLSGVLPLTVAPSRTIAALASALRPQPRVDHVTCTADVCVDRSADGEGLRWNSLERPRPPASNNEWMTCQSSGGNLESTFQRAENCRR